jgi:hypothetical protein
MIGDAKVVHVPFKPFPPGAASDGPIVEYTVFTAKKEPGSKEGLEKTVKDILDLADKHPKCYGTAVGTCVENPDQLVLLLSWPTVEVFALMWDLTKRLLIVSMDEI